MNQNQINQKGLTLPEIYKIGNRPLKIDTENGKITTKIGKNIINYWALCSANRYINIGSKIIQF